MGNEGMGGESPQAYARGDQHRRYTYDDVYEDPALMLAELSGLLATRR